MIGVPIVLDTSVVLRPCFLASGVSVAVLQILEVKCFVCSAVVDEAIYIRGDEPSHPREAVSIDPWIRSGAVDVTSPTGTLEDELYVQFAADLY